MFQSQSFGSIFACFSPHPYQHRVMNRSKMWSWVNAAHVLQACVTLQGQLSIVLMSFSPPGESRVMGGREDVNREKLQAAAVRASKSPGEKPERALNQQLLY